MSEEPAVYRCRVVAEDTDALREFIQETEPGLGCRAVPRGSRDGGVELDLYFPQDRLDRARGTRAASRVNITDVENITENWQARTQEVGGGDRFAARGAVPHGLGRKE
ncbi:hypothetical protein [Streptomyces griseus]|uniref:hypothetical protein n=1 Tax=Streptomyces griseus TaxID=1911 RepID=UPI00055BA6C0|nr:hypothetical protein [Streptomyces griseus]